MVTMSIDEYREYFRDMTVDELIEAFNRDVGNPGWVRARSEFLTALREALLATGLDCSSFINERGTSLAERVVKDGASIVPVSRHNTDRGDPR